MSPCEILLSREALLFNFRQLQKISGALALFPVVKANAYGHGAALLARVLEDEFDSAALPYFCVAQTQEAVELRKAGIKRDILILSAFDKEDFQLGAVENFSFVLSSSRDLANFLTQSDSVQNRSRIHVKFNTGMSRLGLTNEETREFFAAGGWGERLASSSAKIEGVMSHLARSEDDPAILSQTQANEFSKNVIQFNSLLKSKKRNPPKWIHLANSGSIGRGLLKGVVTAGRPGIRLLGAFADENDRRMNAGSGDAFKPVLSLVAPLRKVFEIPAGTGVGYGHHFVSNKNSLIATLGVGYADGLRRRCGTQTKSEKAKSLSVLGHRVPIIGTISMDMVGIDLTDHPKKDEIQSRYQKNEDVLATWIGDGLSAEEVADSLETISYEVFCGLSRRIKRRVV